MEKNFSDYSILILCAGTATRWKGNVFKQLVNIEGNPLLNRTIDQLKKENINNIYIVSWNENLKNDKCFFFTPKKYRYTLESLLYSKEIWGDYTIILLGDVYFSNNIIKKAISNNKNILFYGRINEEILKKHNRGEIFLLTFSKEMHSILENILKELIIEAEKGNKGILWSLYQYLSMKKNIINNEDIFININDETSDFDTLQEYNDWIKINKKKGEKYE